MSRFFSYQDQYASWLDGSQDPSGRYIKCCREDRAPELSGADSNPNTNPDAYTDPDAEADCNPGTDTNPNPGSDPNSGAYADSNTEADCNSGAYPDTDSGAYSGGCG